MATNEQETPEAELTADAVAERVFGSLLGAFECMSIYLGDQLGWYASLAESGPTTSAELAERTGCQERYAREWLEHQAVSGFVTATVGDASTRRYTLPPAVAEVMTDVHSLAFLAPATRFAVAAGAQMPALLAAYRNGGGVTWEQFGDDAREAQAAMNRPWFESQLARVLADQPELDGILRRPDAVIGDVGCGAGWSTIALALAYPDAAVAGYDVDAPSVEMARRHARDAGLDGRVSFNLVSGEQLGAEKFDAVFAFECVHDMPRPVEVLAAVRSGLKPGGLAVIVDEAVQDQFTAPADDTERLFYGFSVLFCLPDGLASPPSAGTGTVMRRGVLEGYAVDAGFSTVEVLPIDDFSFFRFYLLRP